MTYSRERLMEIIAAEREYDRLHPSPKIKDMTEPPEFAEITMQIQVPTICFLEKFPEGTLEEFAQYVREYAEEELEKDMMFARVLTNTGEEI